MSKFHEEEISRKGSVCQCPPPTYQATPRHSGLGGVLRVSVSVAGSLQSPSVGGGVSTEPHPESLCMAATDTRARGAAPREEGPDQHKGPVSILPPT